MNKKILVTLGILGIVVIIIIGYWIYTKPELQTNAPATTIGIRILNDNSFLNNKYKLHSFTDETPLVFKNTNTDTEVSFRGVVAQARNPGSILYINENKIKEVDGQSIIETSFSPDNKYFSFRTLVICGAQCEDSIIYIVNLKDKTVLILQPPRKKTDFSEDKSMYQPKAAYPFIESYNWNGESLKVIFYFTGIDRESSKTYRISPKEIWNYNLATNQYTLVETLLE